MSEEQECMARVYATNRDTQCTKVYMKPICDITHFGGGVSFISRQMSSNYIFQPRLAK